MVHPIPRLATITTLVAAVTTTLAVAGTGVAHAQELSYADNASDVHAFQPDGSTVLLGDVVNTDVTSTTVDHRNKRVKATFRYTDLDRTGQAFVALLHLRTSDGKRFNLPLVRTANIAEMMAFEFKREGMDVSIGRPPAGTS